MMLLCPGRDVKRLEREATREPTATHTPGLDITTSPAVFLHGDLSIGFYDAGIQGADRIFPVGMLWKSPG